MLLRLLSILILACSTSYTVMANVLDTTILDNLEKNNVAQEVYEYANQIFSEKQVYISETQAEINFKANAIKQIFDLELTLPESEFELLNFLIQNDMFQANGVKELLNTVTKKQTLSFACDVLKKNSKVSLEEISNYIWCINFDEALEDEALNLIIKNNSLLFVRDIFTDRILTQASELNTYAKKRLEYDSTNSMSDSLLKEFLEYANQDENKSKLVDSALKENNKDVYNSILIDMQKAKTDAENRAKELKKKEEWEYCKKCFLSPGEHSKNFFAYDRRSTSAFCFGLLNPINLVETILLLPIYAILSPFSGLH